MTFRYTPILAASGLSLALALAACGDNPAEVTEAEPAATTTTPVAEFDPLTRDYTLGEAAQTRRADFDAEELESSYAAYREEIRREQVRMGEAADPGADMSDDGRAEMAAASQQRDATTNMRARSNMTWGYLDRDDDGKLSVAEYAIWAIPLDPDAPVRNDETAPYLTADQANRAADSFFYYDVDGDTLLSPDEFAAARRGDTIAAA